MRKFIATAKCGSTERSFTVLSGETASDVKRGLVARYGDDFVSLSEPSTSDKELIQSYADSIMEAQDKQTRIKLLTTLPVSFQPLVQKAVIDKWHKKPTVTI